MKKTLALIFVFMFILTFAVACGDISVEVGIDEYPDSLKPSGDLWGDVSLDIDTKPTSSDSTSGGSSSTDSQSGTAGSNTASSGSSSTGSTAGDSQPSSSSGNTSSSQPSSSSGGTSSSQPSSSSSSTGSNKDQGFEDWVPII